MHCGADKRDSSWICKAYHLRCFIRFLANIWCLASAWNWMWAIFATKSAVSKMKWVKVQLPSFLSAVTYLHASTSLEPRMYAKYDVYFSFCTVCQLDSTEGWCLQSKTKTGTPTQGWSQLHTTSQWIYRKLTSGYWRKLLFMYESSAYRGLDQVCFIHPWLANWVL